MVTVSKTWIKKHVASLKSEDGRISLASIDKMQTPPGGFPVTLSEMGKRVVEDGDRSGEFKISLSYKYRSVIAKPKRK